MMKEIIELLRELFILIIWGVVTFSDQFSDELKWAFAFGYLVYLGLTSRLDRLLDGEGTKEYFENQWWPSMREKRKRCEEREDW